MANKTGNLTNCVYDRHRHHIAQKLQYHHNTWYVYKCPFSLHIIQ